MILEAIDAFYAEVKVNNGSEGSNPTVFEVLTSFKSSVQKSRQSKALTNCLSARSRPTEIFDSKSHVSRSSTKSLRQDRSLFKIVANVVDDQSVNQVKNVVDIKESKEAIGDLIKSLEFG